MLILRLI